VEDLGLPVAYLALREGVPVYDRDRQKVGVVEHVLAAPDLDIFEGIVVHTVPLPGRHLFADVEQISELRERGVVLRVGAGELHEPPEPADGMNIEPDEALEDPLARRLRHAWDWIRAHD
jgi:uncharacterized protein YrrD